jgi:phosphotransferase system enzyme I (PtsI)
VDSASVLVADDLSPSMAAQVDWRKIHGFASDTGSRTHHTSILARSLHVPAVVGLGTASQEVTPGSIVVIDGTTGELIVDPPADLVARVRAQAGRPGSPAVAGPTPVPAITTDGVAVALQANIELPEDVATAREYGAEGIGLYRSEYMLAANDLESLTEEIQYEAYRALLEAMAPGPVSIRTFDVGEERTEAGRRGGRRAGDVQAATRPGGPLGLRAIRLSLARREVFKTQLRALLRASSHGRLRVIFPFVSGIEELLEARAVLREALEELRSEGRAPAAEPPVGVMIEIPSAALTSDLLAREAAFFSIGTNDLTQYALAVDRTDAGVSELFEPLHPGVLRMLRLVVRAGHRAGIPVSLCGEMASDPVIIPLLLGLGLTDLSMNPAAIPAARHAIRETSAADARRLAARVMRMATAEQIEQCLSRAAARERDPGGIRVE